MKYERLYYTIGQVSKIAGLPQSVLRYWETVFDALEPPKSEGGTRQYTEADVELILHIKKLLYEDGYTIKGANRHIGPRIDDDSDSENEVNEDTQGEKLLSDQNTLPLEQTKEKNEVLDRTLQSVIKEIKSLLQILD